MTMIFDGTNGVTFNDGSAQGVATATIMTSTNRAIRARVQTGAASCTIYFVTNGWNDTRGRIS